MCGSSSSPEPWSLSTLSQHVSALSGVHNRVQIPCAFVCVQGYCAQRRQPRLCTKPPSTATHTLLTQSRLLEKNQKPKHQPSQYMSPSHSCLYLFSFTPRTPSSARKGRGWGEGSFWCPSYSDGTRDRVTQPCVWLLSVVLQSTEALLHRETTKHFSSPRVGEAPPLRGVPQRPR